MIDNEVVTRIAQKLRATRLEKNMTIQQLATRTHVSKGLVSKIENSRTIPSLPVFVALIQSLDISLKDFFQDMILANGRQFRVIRKEMYELQSQAAGSSLNYRYLFSQNIPSSIMKVGLMTLDAGSKAKQAIVNGYEFCFILSGSCGYQISNNIDVLEEGDAIYLDASIPHGPINTSDRLVTILVAHFMLAE